MDASSLEIGFTAIAWLVLAGGFAGFVDAIAGGGGIITVPALMAVGVPPHLALGTNKLQASFGSFTATLNYRRGGQLNIRAMLPGIIFTAIGAVSGTLTLQLFSGDFLQHLIPLMLGAIFIYLLVNPSVGMKEGKPRMSALVFYLIFGLLIGGYDGFFGPGTGSFWTIAFATVMCFDLTKATAHTKVLNFTSNIIALITFIAAGQVIWLAGIAMGIAQIGGAYIGSSLVMKKGARFVRVFFLIVVGITIAKLITTTYFS